MFKYTNDKDFARRVGKPDGYVCYRTIICHALFAYNKEFGDDIKNLFEALYSDYEHSEIYQKEHFLEAYPVPMDNGSGYLLVDKTKGCFPLVFYPSSKNTNDLSRGSRKEALDNTFIDLNNNIKNIIDVFAKYKEKKWDKPLQDNLQNYFDYGGN